MVQIHVILLRPYSMKVCHSILKKPCNEDCQDTLQQVLYTFGTQTLVGAGVTGTFGTVVVVGTVDTVGLSLI
jgi:hypothetical protein